MCVYVCVCDGYRKANKVVSYAGASACLQDHDANSSDMDTAAVAREGMDSAEDGESLCSVDPVAQPRRLSGSRQSRQSTGSADEGESLCSVDPVPQPHRFSCSRQSRQSTGSVEEGESLCSVDCSPQPLRRSSREPRQRDLSIEGCRDMRIPSSCTRKKRRLSETRKPESSEENLSDSSHSISASSEVCWTSAMVGLYSYCMYYYVLYALCTVGCAPRKGGGEAQDEGLDEGGGVHGGWAEY